MSAIVEFVHLRSSMWRQKKHEHRNMFLNMKKKTISTKHSNYGNHETLLRGGVVVNRTR